MFNILTNPKGKEYEKNVCLPESCAAQQKLTPYCETNCTSILFKKKKSKIWEPKSKGTGDAWPNRWKARASSSSRASQFLSETPLDAPQKLTDRQLWRGGAGLWGRRPALHDRRPTKKTERERGGVSHFGDTDAKGGEEWGHTKTGHTLGPEDHTKRSKSQEDKYVISLPCRSFKNGTNELIYTQSHRHRKQRERSRGGIN